MKLVENYGRKRNREYYFIPDSFKTGVIHEFFGISYLRWDQKTIGVPIMVRLFSKFSDYCKVFHYVIYNPKSAMLME